MNHWMDILRFEPLVERLTRIDAELDRIEHAGESIDLDAHGLLDDMEDLIGEGFLLCQLYMIERKGEQRPTNPYACGPRHSGHYLAQVIYTAGNYRKHRGEWPRDESRWGPQQNNTVAMFRDAGVVESEFWLSNLLFHITTPSAPRFGTIVPRLIEWREALDRLPQRDTPVECDPVS